MTCPAVACAGTLPMERDTSAEAGAMPWTVVAWVAVLLTPTGSVAVADTWAELVIIPAVVVVATMVTVSAELLPRGARRLVTVRVPGSKVRGLAETKLRPAGSVPVRGTP